MPRPYRGHRGSVLAAYPKGVRSLLQRSQDASVIRQGRSATPCDSVHRNDLLATCSRWTPSSLRPGLGFRYTQGVAIPPDNKPISFEQEVRVTFDRIRESLRKLDADMDKIVSIKVYLTDLAPYAEFSKVRGEVFPHNPPTSSAVQVAGLLLGARIEIDAVALSPRGETR